MGKCGTIYLVDDDPSARNGLSRLLLAAGYEVCAFASSEKFLATYLGPKNACLLLDARMPGLTGVALHETLAARGLDLPVIFVTADDDKESWEKAHALKASAFFHKPIDGPALLDAIAWALKRHTDRK